MKKLLCFLAILLSFCGAGSLYAEGKDVFVCSANFCYLFVSPSFLAEKVEKDGEILKISHKDEVVLELEDGAPKEYFDENYVFYKVESFAGEQLESAYIFQDFVAKIDDILTFPAYNASINKNTVLFQKEGENFVESGVEIENGTRIYLYEGFMDDKYLPVALEKDNALLYGYVLKDVVAPNGINPLFIYAATIAIAAIGIIIALLFMKNKSSKKATRR